MDLRQLRYFTAIAESGSLSKAAERLHIAQPALSMHLARLESEIGTTLMVRTNRGVTLTVHGENLLQRAQWILRECEVTVNAFRASSKTTVGTVTIGFLSTTPSAVIQKFLVRASEAYPEIHLKLIEGTSDKLEDDLRSGLLDVAVLMARQSIAEFEIHPLLFEELFLVSPPGTPGEETIDFEVVCDLPLFLPRHGIALRDLVEEMCASVARVARVKHEIGTARFMKNAVYSGIGHTILPWSTLVEDETDTLVIRRIVNPEIRALVGLAESMVRPTNPARQAVHGILAEVISGLVGEGTWNAKAYGKTATLRSAIAPQSDAVEPSFTVGVH